MAAFVLACTAHACAGAPAAPPNATADAPSPLGATPPTVEELKNTTYTGLDEQLGPVTLTDGTWTGAPYAGGAAASRPVVALANDLRIVGDLDGDRVDEAVVLLSWRTGGTATFWFLAVVTRTNGSFRHMATAALGDRTQVRSVRIEAGRLLVSAVRVGANDPACCPSELVDWQWTLDDGRLNPVGAERPDP